MRFPRIPHKLDESTKRGLVDRPFRVRAASGALLEARAYGYKEELPQVEVGNRKLKGMSWMEVRAAVELGAVADITKLGRLG